MIVTRLSILISIACGLALCVEYASAAESAVSLESLLREMTDRDAVARLPEPPYVCRQASSYDHAQTDPSNAKTWFANLDQGQFIRTEKNEERKEWVIMDHQGPGSVVRFWTPLNGDHRKAVIRFYFDGATTPTIVANFNELMSGRGFVKPPLAFIASDEKTVEGVGGDLYLPIPFAKSCKITLDQTPFYYIINYRSYDADAKVKTFTMADFKAGGDLLKQTARTLDDFGNIAGGTPLRKDGTLEPGSELSLDLPAGSNAVRTLEVQIDPKDAPQALRSIVVSADFDGEATVWCPLGEFFGCGARLNPVKDWFRDVEQDGKMTARWVMPYRESGRVAFKNVGKKAVAVKLSASTGPWTWDARSMHFHANWREQNSINTRPMSDWNYIEIHGRGVYVGDTLTVLNRNKAWYGEGDERVYVDGEYFPSHLGTGTEDYYGYAWGMAHWFNSPFIAMPKRDVANDQRWGSPNWSGYTTTSRVRLLDGISYRTSLKLDMEIWHAADTTVDYAVGTFWYARPGATSNCKPTPSPVELKSK